MANAVDKQGNTWRAVKEWADSRLASSRSALEAHGTAPEQTEYERGRIAVLKELLSLPEQKEIKTTFSADTHVE